MIFFDSKMCFTSTKKLNKYFEFLEMMWKFTTISFDDFFRTVILWTFRRLPPFKAAAEECLSFSFPRLWNSFA